MLGGRWILLPRKEAQLLPTPTGWATPRHICGAPERTATPDGLLHLRLAGPRRPTNRWLVVQPVPTNFIILRLPIAVWRGDGNDASLGHAGAALLLVSLYVTQVAETWRTEDCDCAWSTYSFPLGGHQAAAKVAPTSHNRPPRPGPDPGTQWPPHVARPRRERCTTSACGAGGPNPGPI